ncbi:hypothetical protein CEE44_04695 [Candidatus Woesearchaeota archaeon B3_Woes]|nr:MAG: hypothetical protein CEE44_04695 [Candidatus Woesearchaeota archaeon B3_Woes]
MFNPKDFIKKGCWPNGEYFNGLYFRGEDKEYHKKAMGLDYESRDLITVNDVSFFPVKDNKKYGNFIKKNPQKFLKKFNKKCLKRMNDLKQYADKHKNDDFKNLSDEELLKEKEKFEEKVRVCIPFLFPLLFVGDIVEEDIIKKVPNIKFDEIRPIRRVSAGRMNDDLLESKKSIKELEKEYAWYNMNLTRGQPLTIDDLKEIKKSAKKTIIIKVSKNEYVKEMQKLMWFRFERIDAYNYAFYWMFPLYSEIFRRIKVAEKYWDVFLPFELDDALISKKIPKNLDSRFTHRGVIKEDGVIRHLTIKEFERYKREFILVKEQKDIVKGRPACPGIVKGRVKVVKGFEDIKKIKEGNILVAAETLVQYEPYLRKTKAMVVEIGGMLCHTAIFAREFKIPCIVGANNATGFFKDNDLVEVDANKGIVRKINK